MLLFEEVEKERLTYTGEEVEETREIFYRKYKENL